MPYLSNAEASCLITLRVRDHVYYYITAHTPQYNCYRYLVNFKMLRCLTVLRPGVEVHLTRTLLLMY